MICSLVHSLWQVGAQSSEARVCDTRSLQVDTGNPQVVQQHVLCAAAEMPVDPSPWGRDAPYFGHLLQVGTTVNPQPVTQLPKLLDQKM
jgi:hypothetical protein